MTVTENYVGQIARLTAKKDKAIEDVHNLLKRAALEHERGGISRDNLEEIIDAAVGFAESTEADGINLMMSIEQIPDGE